MYQIYEYGGANDSVNYTKTAAKICEIDKYNKNGGKIKISLIDKPIVR
jgi:hypothetical protein